MVGMHNNATPSVKRVVRKGRAPYPRMGTRVMGDRRTRRVRTRAARDRAALHDNIDNGSG